MSFSNLGLALQVVIALFGAFFLAFWISLIIWTFRDVRSRSRDIFAQLLATLMVIIFNVPGLILYFMLRPQETLAEQYERALEEEALLQDIEERYSCPGCKQKIRADYQFCPSCHARLKQPCPSCEQLLQLQWEMCPYCGATPAPNSQVSDRQVSLSSRRSPQTKAQPVTEAFHPHVEDDTVRLTEISSRDISIPEDYRPDEKAEERGAEGPTRSHLHNDDTLTESLTEDENPLRGYKPRETE